MDYVYLLTIFAITAAYGEPVLLEIPPPPPATESSIAPPMEEPETPENSPNPPPAETPPPPHPTTPPPNAGQLETEAPVVPVEMGSHPVIEADPPPKKRTSSRNRTSHNDQWYKGILIEFKPSYFYPTSSEFREIFQDGSVDYQATVAAPVYHGENVWIRGIDIWAAFDYFSRHGRAAGGPSSDNNTITKIQVAPVTLGVKYFFPGIWNAAPINFYLAAGVSYYFVQTNNYTSSVQRTITANGFGGRFEFGATITLYNHLVFDLFTAYGYRDIEAPTILNKSAQGTSLNVSSFNAGLGIGYKF